MGRGAEIEQRFAAFPAAGTVKHMLEHGLNAPPTSSCGRLFDAAVGLLGIMPAMAFEGQAAMLLESLAARHGDSAPLPGGYLSETDGALNFLPLLDALSNIGDAGRGAALFHATLADGLAQWVIQAARHSGLDTVTLGGGCFLNAILSRRLRDALQREGLTALEAHQVPSNDGGLSLGQTWVAMNPK
jgi:hydrogenase maturation protein HypF